MLTEDEVAALCTAGAMAPSGGNDQPWLVTVRGDRLLVAPDPRRGSFLDVAGCAAHFAVGCFAENVAITARSLGLEYTLDRTGGTVGFTVTGRHEAVADPLAASIPGRVTNRRAGDGTELAVTELEPLSSVVDPAFRVTAVSTADAKATIGRALGVADVVRMRNPTMFADMVRELCWSDRETTDRRDGLDPRTLELPGATMTLLSVLRRAPWLRALLPPGRLAETARLLVAGSSHICCLSTREPLTPETMVDAGRSLQRLWLAATRAGIWLHPWTVSTLLLARLETFDGLDLTAREVAGLATVGAGLRSGFGLQPADHPVFVFRLFRAQPPPARSLRREWQSFTTIEEGTDDAR